MLSLLFILACGDETETTQVEENAKTEAPVESDNAKASDKDEVEPIPSKLVEKVEEIEKPSSQESSESEESADAEKPAIH
tara:strand:- start:186 stop:425 length:240 start_codon:yes stop_codon:yes gene_type:complete